MSLLDLLNDPPETQQQYGIQRPFKTAEEAYRQDVAPRAQQQGSGSLLDLLGPAPAQVETASPVPAKTAAKPSGSNFGRGWDVSGKQLKQTAYGTAALIGDTFGSDSLKKWGLQGYKDAEKEIQAISKESDSFTSAVQSGDIGSWLTYSAGYLAGQFADLAVASAAGAVVGGSLSGPAAPAGAAAGAVTGAINKAAVQTGLRGAVSKMIDRQAASLTATYIERGMVKEAAEKAAAEQAVKSVYRTIGATTANTFLNATGELGSIYGEAVEEAAKTGQEYSLGKIWLSGIAATAVDTWADSKAVKGLTDAFKGKNRVSSIAMEAFKGGMREGLTEGTQTVIERWGADKDLTSKEAFKEYIDSAAVGVLGGTAAGGASGAVSKLQANTGKPEVDQTQANFTKLPESQSGRTRPLDEADTPAMPQGEMLQTLSNPGFVAALYQQSDDAGKQVLRDAVERAGFQEAFGKALQDPDQIAYGAKMIQNSPDFVPAFVQAVEQFATTQSPAGTFKADKRGAKPQVSQEEEFDQRAQQEGFTLTERPGGPAPAASPRPPRPEPVQPSSETNTVTDEEGQRAPIENRDELIAKFNGVGNEIFEGEMTPPKEARYDWAMKQLINAGFKPAEARSILTGQTTPAVAEQSAPNLDEQGALDEAVDAAADQQAAAQTRLTEPKVTRNSPPADPDANWSPTVTLDYGDYTIENDGTAAVYSLKAPVELSSTAKLTGIAAGNDRVTLLAENLSGERVNVRVREDHIRLEKPGSAAMRDYEFDGSNSVDLDRILGSDLMTRLDAAEPEERVGMVLEAVTQKLGLDSLDRFSAEFENMRQGRPSQASANPAEKPAANPLGELQDAFANLGDVLTDALGTKQNITGQRYTMADVPDALVKVMKALLKAGVAQFKDASDQLMQKMRANPDWAPLADKVDQGMLLKAWNQAGGKNVVVRADEQPGFVGPQEKEESRPTGDFRRNIAAEDDDGVTFQRTKAQGKKKEAAPSQPKGQLPLGISAPKIKAAEPEPILRLKSAIERRIKQTTNASFYEDSIRKLQKELTEIDDKLRSMDTVEVQEGKRTVKFRARQEGDENPGMWGQQDENAYDRFEGGMIYDKASPKNELLERRRKITEDLEKTRDGSRRGQARLYRLGMDRLSDYIIRKSEDAIRGGANPEAVREAVRPYLDGFGALREAQANQQEQEQAVDPALEEINRNLAQSDFLEGERVAMGLLSDFRSKRVSQRELEALEMRGLRDGDFTLRDLLKAYEAFGVSPQQRLFAAMKHFSTRISLKDYVAQQGGAASAVDAYFLDMAQARDLMGGKEFESRYSQRERDLLDLWQRDRREVLARRRVTKTMRESDDPRKAFDGFLFTRITLTEARNPDLIQSPTLRQTYKGLFDNLEEAWFSDVAAALRLRPDLADAMFRQEMMPKWEGLGTTEARVVDLVERDPVISPDDRRDFQKWVDRLKAGIQKQAEVLARAPYFTALRNDPMLDAVTTAEGFPMVSSTPKVDVAQTGMSADLESQDGRGVRRAEYEVMYAKVLAGEFEAVQDLLDFNARMKAMQVGSVDPETGEIITQQMYDELAADALDSILMNAQMVEPDRSNVGKRIDGDGKVVRTVEEAAERDAQIGAQTSSLMDDLSTDEQIQEGVISEFEGETQEAADADSEVEEGRGADEGPAAEQAAEEKKGGRVPKSLVPGMEYRFRRGKAWDVFSMTAVQDIVNRLTSGWKNAANVIVLPNAQHLPEPLRSRVIEKLAGSGAKGLYHEGNVYLFSQHLEGEADVEFTLFHESYGHLGMRAVLGEKFDQFLETAYRTRPEVREATDALVADGMPKLEAIDEVLSDMAGGNRNVSVVKQWVGKIISGLREIGLTRVADWFASMTDAEVASTLVAARDAVRNGTLPAMNGAPSEIRFKEVRPPYEVFATKDGKTTGYARYNPVTDSWAVFSADGANIKDGYTTTTTQDFDEVVKAMKHRGKVEYRLRSGLFVDDKIVADLVELPKFNDAKKYPIRPFAQSWATNTENAKKRWAQLRRLAQLQFQNEYLPVFEVIEFLESKGRITPQTDVKTALMLYERRAGYLVEDFRKRYAEPIQKLVEQAGTLGVTKKDIDRYLTARHAFERNAVIASINPEMPDGGSGLSSQQADEILRSVRSSPAGQVLEEIGRLTDKMSKEKVSYLSRTGMITKKLAEKLNGYDHYVNLSGEAGAELDADDPGLLAGGSKFNVKGKERRALGRGEGNEASDVLSRTIQSYEAALIRGQKNEVAKKVLALIETNYSSEFAVVNRQAFRKQFNPETGEVEEVLDENYMARKDVMVAKVGGIPTTIEFKERGLGTFADAIHGMVSPAQSGPIMESVGKVSRFLGSLLTTYNPAFTLVNGFRDIQTMYLNAAADGRVSQKMARDMIKALPSAFMSAVREASGYRFARGPRTDMDKVLAEMQREGGITYFADRKGLEDQVRKLDDLLSGKKYPMQETFQRIGGALEFLADVSEIAPRLAAYKVVKENGFSKEQAAVFSGDITVNFNMRGANKEVRQLYVFFNPAVQGSYKLYKLATTKEGQKQFAKIALALTAFGFLTSLLGRAVSGEDDDGIDKLDKVPVYKRATSVVVSADSVWGAPLPVPYGWNAFFATGVFMADTVLGKQPLNVTAGRIAKTTAEAFSPIGMGAMDAKSFETFVAKFVAPTVFLPGVEFAFNENRFGAPILKQQSQFDPAELPDAQKYFRGVSPISRAITDGLTSLTKGNKYNPGGIDVSPATIDFLIQSYLPGVPTDIYKGAGVAIRAAQGEDIKRAPWPIADRFSARIPTGYDAGAYRRAAEMVETVYQEYSKTRDQGRRQEIRAEYPRIGYAHAVIASTTQELRQVRKQIADLEERRMPDDQKVARKNQLMEREEAIFKRATKRLMEAGEPIREAMMANE